MAGGGSTGGFTVYASAELYDPNSGTWSPTGAMAAGRSSHSAAVLPDGRVLVAGGHSLNANGPLELVSAELYHPQTGGWTPAAPIRAPRATFAAADLPGRVLVMGGFNLTPGSLNSAEVYR